jgi:hypothetical protein
LTVQSVIDDDHDENGLKKKFVYRYLQGDGAFMLRLVASNVNDYVCRKMITELYQIFCQSLKAQTIGRERLFKPIRDINEHDDISKQDENDDDGSTDQTIAPDIPPIPNPRQGKIFLERDIFPKLPLDITDIEQTEPQQTDSSSRLTTAISGPTRVRSSQIPLLKDLRRTMEIKIDSSDITTPRYKNVEFNIEPDTALSSALPSPSIAPLHLPPPPPALKGPSPYATTYLTSRKRSEHELPYIDDSISSGSTSGRLTSTTVVQKSEKPTTLGSTNIFFRRSHDV